MNETQRQLLADELDDTERAIERYEKAIAVLNHKVLVKQTRLHELKEKKRKLEEGVDW